MREITINAKLLKELDSFCHKNKPGPARMEIPKQVQEVIRIAKQRRIGDRKLSKFLKEKFNFSISKTTLLRYLKRNKIIGAL